MVQIPDLYQSAGWLGPTVLFVGVAVLSYFTSMYLTKAMTQVPGNRCALFTTRAFLWCRVAARTRSRI
jgi:hypothetical protein